MCVQGYPFMILLGLAASCWLGVRGMKVYTSEKVEAVNGTDIRLKCTFESSVSIRPSALTVSWSFQPLGRGQEESVFYYHEKPFPPLEGRFRKKAKWAGDIYGQDASIVLHEVKFTYNGTFSCQVKNPPDVHGEVGKVQLRVVTSASFSEIAILAAAVGGGIVVMIMVLVIIVLIRRCRNKRLERPPKERKDPTLCHPSKAVHLYIANDDEVFEIDSSDGMISDPSTGDPSSSEEEDDDDDDDDDGGDDDD